MKQPFGQIDIGAGGRGLIQWIVGKVFCVRRRLCAGFSWVPNSFPMSTPSRRFTRRRFLARSAALAAGAAVAAKLPPRAAGADPAGMADFASNWNACPDRVWLGPEFWSNPLQDWRIAGGRIECTNAAVDRNVHLLVRALGEHEGSFSVQVRLGRVDGTPVGQGRGSAGFRIGVRGPLPDFRNSLIFGRGLDAGLTAQGGLFIGLVSDAVAGAVKLDAAEVELRLTGTPAGENYQLSLTATDKAGRELGSVAKAVPRERCVGNLVLVNNFGVAGGAGGAGGAGKAAKAAKAAAAAAVAGS